MSEERIRKVAGKLRIRHWILFFSPALSFALLPFILAVNESVARGEVVGTYERIGFWGSGLVVFILVPLYFFVLPFILFNKERALKEIGFKGLFLNKVWRVKDPRLHYFLAPLFLAVTTLVIMDIFGIFFEERYTALPFAFYPLPYWWLYIWMPVVLSVMSFLEEVYFRGTLFAIFGKVLPGAGLVVLSTVYFFVFHLPDAILFGGRDLSGYFVIAAFGLVASLLFLRNRNLDRVILLHYAVNVSLLLDRLFVIS